MVLSEVRSVDSPCVGLPTEARVLKHEAHLRWPAFNRQLRWATFACARAKVGAGNGIRTRDFDLGKVALYH
jgi:hypothetical protein